MSESRRNVKMRCVFSFSLSKVTSSCSNLISYLSLAGLLLKLSLLMVFSGEQPCVNLYDCPYS